MTTYTVWSLDVWGHAPEDCEDPDENGECSCMGFQVNDRCRVGTIELFKGLSDQGILDMLGDQGYINAERCRVDEGWSYEDNVYITSKSNGRPLLQLEASE